MDSRQLYIGAKHLHSKLRWEEDWIHFGTGGNLNYPLVKRLVSDFLDSKEIKFVYKRTNSGVFEYSQIFSIIKELLGKSNFELWNDTMERAIQFHKIGVLCKGEKQKP